VYFGLRDIFERGLGDDAQHVVVVFIRSVTLLREVSAFIHEIAQVGVESRGEESYTDSDLGVGAVDDHSVELECTGFDLFDRIILHELDFWIFKADCLGEVLLAELRHAYVDFHINQLT